MNAKNLTARSFKPLLERAGLPHSVRLHDLRHTCATVLLKLGQHPKFVQELLGHANIGITLDTYSHVLPSLDEDLAAVVTAHILGRPAGLAGGLGTTAVSIP